MEWKVDEGCNIVTVDVDFDSDMGMRDVKVPDIWDMEGVNDVGGA